MVNLKKLDKTKIYAIENINDFGITLMVYGPIWYGGSNSTWCLYNHYFEDWYTKVDPIYWTVIGEM